MPKNSLKSVVLLFAFLARAALARASRLQPYEGVLEDFRVHFGKHYDDESTRRRRLRCFYENLKLFVDRGRPPAEQIDFRGQTPGERVFIYASRYVSPCKAQAAVYAHSDLCPHEFAATYLDPVRVKPHTKVCDLAFMKARFPEHAPLFARIETGEVDPVDVLLGRAAGDSPAVREAVAKFYKLAPESPYPPNYSPLNCALIPRAFPGRLLPRVAKSVEKEKHRAKHKKHAEPVKVHEERAKGHEKRAKGHEKHAEPVKVREERAKGHEKRAEPVKVHEERAKGPEKQKKHAEPVKAHKKRAKEPEKHKTPPKPRPSRRTRLRSPRHGNLRMYINHKKHLGPVRYQGTCKSCYAFAVALGINAQHNINYRSRVEVSTQDVMDCSPHSKGCNGGSAAEAFDYITQHGISFEMDYPYRAADQDCQRKYAPFRIYGRKIVRVFLKPGVLNLAKALHKGVVAAHGSSSPELVNLGRGALTGAYCTLQSPINHTLLMYGYDRKRSPPVFFFMNFWGDGWGNHGLGEMLMGPRTNMNTGVCNYALTHHNFRLDIFD